jgi:acetyl-CoA C-acetyltransferase
LYLRREADGVDAIEILGIGLTKAEEKWNLGLVDIATIAAAAALDDADASSVPSAIVVGNALGAALEDQRNLAVFTASSLGLENIGTYTVCSDEASGGSAIRLAASLILSGLHKTVLVIGAEKTSDALPEDLEHARATGLDAAKEAVFGFNPSIAAALGMQRYLSKYNIDKSMFYHLARTAHFHSSKNSMAIFPWQITAEQYSKSAVISSPLTVLDTASVCDGSAAVLLGAGRSNSSKIKILASSSVNSPTGIEKPVETLFLPAAATAAAAALKMANLNLNDISLFELHDSNAFTAALSIESVGLAPLGSALDYAQKDNFTLNGKTPMWTFGGLKGRGNTLGASGVYQLAEAALQLEGRASDNQVNNAKTALVQSLGSFGALAVTHILG